MTKRALPFEIMTFLLISNTLANRKNTHPKEGIMDYKRRIENAIKYIETHLMDQLSIDQIAQIACWSKFHFQEIFHIFLGYTLFDYILKRKITESASQ